MQQHTFKTDSSIRLSIFLRQNGVSRSLMSYLKTQTLGLTVNGVSAHTDCILKPGDIAAINEPEEYAENAEPNDLKVPILYEDSDVIVYDKPGNMPVHPSAKHYNDTLLNYHAFYTGGKVFRCLNRLDRDTSGCCLAAKSRYSAAVLSGSIKKVYLAVTKGIPPESGVIDKPIRRKEGSLIERECADDGQRAVTHFRRLYTKDGYSLMRVTIDTGRTHQIRVHFKTIGFPLAGDSLYGGDTSLFKRQALHCHSLSFTSPDGGEVCVVSERCLSKDFFGMSLADIINNA